MANPSPLMSLTAEILDAICSKIDERNDLISLAASSQLFSALVLPRHTEYRVLRISTKHPEHLWAHLAKRADLSRNVRVLYIIEDFKRFPLTERYPTTLVENENEVVFPEGGGEDEKAQNIIQAIRNMELLQKFVWIAPWTSGPWSRDSENYNLVWDALSASRSLKELEIVDRLKDLSQSVVCNYSLWRIAELQSLHIGWFFQCQQDNHTHLTSMVALSPNLRSLTISAPINTTALWECRFPHLQTLALSGYSRFFPHELVFRFLEAHHTLEDLTWYPLPSELRLAPGSLSKLKRLTTNNQFAMTILEDAATPQRPLEHVSCIFLNKITLPVLEKTKGCGLRELGISQYDELQSIHRLAEVFPELRTLDIRRFGSHNGSYAHSGYTLDDYIDALSRFPLLESVPDLALWEGIELLPDQERFATVTSLLQRCPNLTRFGYVDTDVVDVVLSRSVEGVFWEQRPRVPK